MTMTKKYLNLNHENIKADLLTELSVAMSYNPGMLVTDVIEKAMDLKYPTRKLRGWEEKKLGKSKRWKFTNEEIYDALALYNDIQLSRVYQNEDSKVLPPLSPK